LRKDFHLNFEISMFHLLGKLVSRTWPLFLVGWLVLLIAISKAAPPWDEVAESGQFSFLPKDVPSNRGQELFKAAFPKELLGSNIVIVLSRQDEVPIYENKDFIERDLKGGLLEIAEEQGGLADDNGANQQAQRRSPIARIRTLIDEGSGALLVNGYQNATLVVIDLTLEFLDRNAWPTVNKVEDLIERLRQETKVPEGLDIALTGSAVVGRDTRQGELKSADAIEKWTIWLVIGLLLIIYRAPLLALIPLATVFFAVQISISLLSILAKHHFIALSETNRIYITILSYGAGVDYCLFLIARYREELRQGSDRGETGHLRESLAEALGKVGGTITASAATVICGIAMLAFAKFGKYHQAGITIPMSLFIVLLSALTFSPSLLRLTGRWAFWPFGLPHPASDQRASDSPGWKRFLRPRILHNAWARIGQALERRPGLIWLASVIVMVPFAAFAIKNYQYLDYGLTNDLPKGSPSLAGTETLEEHFPAGYTGQMTVLVRNDAIDFNSTEGSRLIGKLEARLEKRKDALQIEDVRSIAKPLGTSATAKDITGRLEHLLIPDLTRRLQQQAREYYVSNAGDYKNHVTRLDIVSKLDPLSRSSIVNLDDLELVLRQELPPQLQGSQIEFYGSTVSLRDLQRVTTDDLRLIEVIVPLVVFMILMILLRELLVPIYLIVTVLFSYLATLGVTFALFWLLDPTGFSGLDWKVPIFLFTILVAVGEDYNIFLMTRVQEERNVHGPIRGVTEALIKTGGIISSCGFIMAGTFASLLSGSLTEMKELGFALAFGVLLDTMVVRPLLVPAFVIVLGKIWPGSKKE
jgi:RND superfamily putative drug exporter